MKAGEYVLFEFDFYQDVRFQHARLNVKYILFLIAIVFTEECRDEQFDCELENPRCQSGSSLGLDLFQVYVWQSTVNS